MASTRTGNRSVNATVAAVFGAAFTLVGIAGFFVSETFAEQSDDALLGFQVNHLHNMVHLLIGLALLAASRRTDIARAANLAVGVTYLALGVVGPVLDDTAADVIALNRADHVLHLASGLVLTLVAVVTDRAGRRRA